MAQLPLWASIILAILIFLVAITIIVAVHEAGHLAAAKIFGVYCFDYSIGFGPKIFRKKGKGRETYFSLRAIPLGGFVSMYGEGDPSEEEKEVYIAPSRSLNGISHPKKFVVMGAGVFLNFILGFIILLFTNACLPHMTIFETTAINQTQYSIEKDHYENTGELPLVMKIKENGEDKNLEAAVIKSFTAENGQQIWVLDDNAKLNSSDERYFLCRTAAPASYFDEKIFKDLVIYKSTTEIKNDNDKNIKESLHLDCIPDYMNENAVLTPADENDVLNFTFKYLEYHGEEEGFDDMNNIKKVDNCKMISSFDHDTQKYVFTFQDDSTLLNKFLYMKEMKFNFQEAWNNTGTQYSNGCALIFSTLGKLFQPATFKQISGPVGIVKQTASILQNYNAYTLFYFFGLISINLGIVNLMPFPGLDGWHLFVCLFEGISKKNIPDKVKNWFSVIGLILLFALMGVIIVKDIVGLF